MADDLCKLPGAGAEEEEAMKDFDGGDGDGEEEDYFPGATKVGEEKEIGKQGLKKMLVREGEGWDRPETGDEVEGECIHRRLLVQSLQKFATQMKWQVQNTGCESFCLLYLFKRKNYVSNMMLECNYSNDTSVRLGLKNNIVNIEKLLFFSKKK